MINSFAARVPSLALSFGVPRPLGVGPRLAGQFLFLVALSYAGDALVGASGVPLPGNLVGMLLLLALLRLGVVRLGHVQDAAALMLQHLNLFFLPLAVGLMAWGGLLGVSGVGLGLSLVGSTAVCLAVSGLVGQRLATHGESSDAR